MQLLLSDLRTQPLIRFISDKVIKVNSIIFLDKYEFLLMFRDQFLIVSQLFLEFPPLLLLEFELITEYLIDSRLFIELILQLLLLDLVLLLEVPELHLVLVVVLQVLTLELLLLLLNPRFHLLLRRQFVLVILSRTTLILRGRGVLDSDSVVGDFHGALHRTLDTASLAILSENYGTVLFGSETRQR